MAIRGTVPAEITGLRELVERWRRSRCGHHGRLFIPIGAILEPHWRLLIPIGAILEPHGRLFIAPGAIPPHCGPRQPEAEEDGGARLVYNTSMGCPDDASAELIADRIREQAALNDFRISQHAAEEMGKEYVSVEDLVQVLAGAEILEDYPEHRRGACCLILGTIDGGRDLHVVCTAGVSPLDIITVYEPMPPKWLTPRERSR